MPPKRRRRFHGLYYHSSPPKVMPMNGQAAGSQNGRKRRENDDFSVKLSTIRIWMHEKDIGKLTRILWAGQGQRLCQQASNNGRVKRFLAAVPHVMNATKDLHQAVIDNSLETLQMQLEPPVPPSMVTAKDSNGLNIIHKAAGLGHTKILEYLIGLWPEGAHEIDITGKTPLHWAASAKNNMRCYTLLTQAGCDEEAQDYKMKTPSYYRHKPHEIERAYLVYVPEAPRISPDSVTDWEALSDDSDSNAGGDASSNSSKPSKKLDIKPAAAVNGRKSFDDSVENTSELDTNDGTSVNEDDDLSKPDPDVDVEVDPEAEVPQQRRPETPAAFATGDVSDTAGDTESEAENIARAVSDDEDADKVEPEAAEQPAQDEAEAETEAEADADTNDDEQLAENGDLDAESESEQNATEKTEAIENGNEVAELNEISNETNAETKEHEEDHVEMADATEEEATGDNDEEKDTTGTAAAAAADDEEEDVEEDDDEDVIATTPNRPTQEETQKQLQPEQDLVPDNDGGDSLTSSLAIEGFVQGAAEDFTDATLQQIIESGDMEQLAEIVLNGEGGRLLGLKSKEAEIQAFLNNVPSYMEKIHRVHDAARDGSLLALQQALDRRKFAIAKDDISPNGATPLHVAVLFGHSDIVRYLASRFPETMAITDNDGRTALHYAGTIKDNGHFYNVLTQLGADTKAVDKLGHTPEFYVNIDTSKDVLTYTELLSVFGAEDLENKLLSDQVPDDLHSARRELQDGEISRTLERCFSVIAESGKLLSGTTASALSQRKPLSASALQLSVTSYLSRFLKRAVYERIKRRQTRLDHSLFDVLWPAMRKTSKLRHLEEDINCGIIAPDFDVFVVFQEFLVPFLKDMHCLSIDAEFKPQPRLAYFPMDNGERLNTAAFVFDDESLLVTRCIVEASRNLDQLELPLNLTIAQIEQAERVMMGKIFTASFAEAIGETESGSYYTLTELLDPHSEVALMLNNLGLMIPLLDTKDLVQAAESTAFNGALWPYGRGVYVNSAHNTALWLNCQEHLRIISSTGSKDPADMGAAYTRVGRAVSYLETQLHFKESYLLGYLQSRPAYLGTGLKMTTIVKLPNLMKEMDNLRHLCSVRGLSMVTNRLSKLTVRLINMQSMGVVEYVMFQDYCTAVTNILSLEKDMSLTNSKHIANMLVKIFRRKKNSIIDRN
ncbi:uncharacterized protein LOC6559725 isoform X2 [Drosophila grimshawi]|uniref:uncharacterized protein LOC6559725 isoform X2 n=1 Tax=Drosophila grimshawi TaxID=7222 RepID=UPI000C87037D|nr:uncharacterized protein LOC6559725 isoform X2 [Drosophila grimshawi]